MNSAAFGGGIACRENSDPRVTNNTITKNPASSEGGGFHCCEYSFPILINSIIWENTAPVDPEIDGNPLVTFCDVRGGWPGTGNIDVDPLFADAAGDDFHLTFASPCRDSGDDNAVTELYDFEGDPRNAWGGTVDMGADEFYTHLYVTGEKTPGGDLNGKLVGLPGTMPVGVLIGSGVRETPVPTAYGDFFLLPPRFLISLIPIPADGVLVVPITLPLSPPAPYDIPMQGLVGLNPDSLTNLCVLEVR